MAIDPLILGSYSGVPNTQYTPGQLIQTGTAGPSKVSDYGGKPVYAADGTQLTNPDYMIPGGTWISVGQPPYAGQGGNAVTGSGIVGQAIQKESVEGSLANEAQSNANTLAIAQAQLTQQAAVANQNFIQAQADYALTAARAQQQYQMDVANFGLSQAQTMMNARMNEANLVLQRAQAERDRASFLLQQNQFNASQAQAKEQARENIMEMMASRTGPQDYVAYNNLANGLAAPTPQQSATFDPFAALADLYKESNIAPPEVPDLPDMSSVYASIQGLQPPSMVDIPAFPTGGMITAPTITPQQIIGVPGTMGATATTPSGGSTSTTQGGSTPAPQYGDLINYVGTPGSWGTMSDGTPYYNAGTVTGDQTPLGSKLPNKINIGGLAGGLPRMAQGGVVGSPPAAIVGDGDGKTPSKYSEIAMALIDKVTGRPVLHVIPHEDARQIINRNTIPRAASGGTYGTALSDNMVTYNTYSPEVLGSMPFYKKLTGQSENRPFGGFGATVSNPSLGIYDAPTGINLQNYNQLLGSEQQAFGSLYGQGLALDPDDILEMARRAAPTTKNYTANVFQR